MADPSEVPLPASPAPQVGAAYRREEVGRAPRGARLVLVLADFVDRETHQFDVSAEAKMVKLLHERYPKWWHWLSGVVVLSTDEPVADVAEAVRSVTGSRHLLVTSLAERGSPMAPKGHLPTAAWTWLKDHQP